MESIGAGGTWRRTSAFSAALCLLCLALPTGARAAQPARFWTAPKPPQSDARSAAAGQFDAPRGIGVDPVSGHLFVADQVNVRIDELTAWGDFVRAWGWGVRDGAEELQACALGTGCLKGIPGAEGGQIGNPIGVAVDDEGNVYVDEPAPYVVGSEVRRNLRVQKFNSAGEFVLTFGGDVVAQGVDDSSNDEVQEVKIAATGGSFRLSFTNPFPAGGTAQTAPIPYNASAAEVEAALEGLATLGGEGGSVAVSGGPGDAGGTNPYTATFEGALAGDDVPQLTLDASSLAPPAGSAVTTTNSGGGPEICRAAAGDACKAGAPGSAPGEFALPENRPAPACLTGCGEPLGSKIALGPGGLIFVGDKERVEKFNANGEYQGEVAVPGETIQSLAIDGAGNLYAGLFTKGGVSKLDPTGKEVHHYAVQASHSGGGNPTPRAVAVDAAGDLYAVAQAGQPFIAIGAQQRVVAFAADGSQLIPSKEEEEEEKEAGQKEAEGKEIEEEERPFAEIDGATLAGLAVSEACGIAGHDLYVSAFSGTPFDGQANLRAYGTPPQDVDAPCEAPPNVAPTVLDQYATSAATDSATLRAKVNPHFWSDSRYYIEYGTGKCSKGGCEAKKPAPPGTLLTASVLDAPVTTKAILLTALAPNTTYHYRFVAQSSGGGPVFGTDPDGEGPQQASIAEGLEASFTTPSQSPPSPDPCPNAANRSGPSAFLPDCRAYEMVSPLDKNGGDIVGVCNVNCYRTELNQASADGEELTYSSYKGFAGSPGGLFSNQYVASRGGGGWSTRGISPPRRVGLFGDKPNFPYGVDIEFKAFSGDLASAWLVDSSLDPLTADAAQGFVNVYRRDNKAGTYEALTRSAPTIFKERDMRLEFQGASADGSHAIFQARAALTADASTVTESGDPIAQLYDYSGGELHLASVLPGETANSQSSTAGIQNQGTAAATHGNDTLAGAISADGSRIFWTSSGSEGPGQLYARIDGQTTIPVSAGSGARFWAATASGSDVLYSEGEGLFHFEVGSLAREEIAKQVLGVAGQSEDFSRIYFVSKAKLAAGAKAGDRNLYLDQKGVLKFIAALSATDAEAGNVGLSDDDPRPNSRMTRVTPDGSAIAFMSNRPLTGYDSRDAVSGEPDWEVFLYNASTQQLACASCRAGGIRPSGQQLTNPKKLPGASAFNTGIWAAAWLNVADSSLSAPRPLSSDGKRLFFNAFDALVPRDSNGAQDVYEWEALGSGDCTKASAAFSAVNGGCVSLISSGESLQDSVFVDASPDGRDVFFKTQASLDPTDPGLIDIYDARAGGGFTPPPPPQPPCVGDACQSVPAAPNDPTPASAGFHGSGNPSAPKTCPRGKHRVKSRCVAKKPHKRRHRRGHGRAAR
jgi:WD40-like Beta Propeller Repeat